MLMQIGKGVIGFGLFVAQNILIKLSWPTKILMLVILANLIFHKSYPYLPYWEYAGMLLLLVLQLRVSSGNPELSMTVKNISLVPLFVALLPYAWEWKPEALLSYNWILPEVAYWIQWLNPFWLAVLIAVSVQVWTLYYGKSKNDTVEYSSYDEPVPVPVLKIVETLRNEEQPPAPTHVAPTGKTIIDESDDEQSDDEQDNFGDEGSDEPDSESNEDEEEIPDLQPTEEANAVGDILPEEKEEEVAPVQESMTEAEALQFIKGKTGWDGDGEKMKTIWLQKYCDQESISIDVFIPAFANWVKDQPSGKFWSMVRNFKMPASAESGN